ncbi:MAG: bifunctional nuclease domain-containing protein [Verrucomicrobiota bacterium]
MIPVKVDQLFFSNMGFVVLLKQDKQEKTLPIFIGAAEAQAIALHLNEVEVPRPLTHDLLKNILDFLECRLKRIEITSLDDGTFYAQLILERDGNELVVDSRPSDAIALALRFNGPIYVADEVMHEAGRVFSEEETAKMHDAAGTARKGAKSKQKRLTPLEMLEKQLENAVKDERYEDAARLRDEINRHKGSSTQN